MSELPTNQKRASVLEVEARPEIKRIAEILAEIGLEIDKVAPRIIDRLELLDQRTETIKDAERAVKTAREVFKYYESAQHGEAFSELEKRIVLVGSVFSDIGKTGPLTATPEQRSLITEIFSIENVKNPKMTIQDFFIMYFPDTAEQKTAMFQEMGLDSTMPMRSFWNLHSLWTLQIISGDGVPVEAIAGAAIHHIIEGVNPDNILGLNSKFNKYFGENASLDRPEKLIIILDQFYAFFRRSGMAKEDAIEAVRTKINNNESFHGDAQFQILLDDLLRVVSTSTN